MSERVEGLRDIARVLGCSPTTVRRLSRRKRDPLRLWRAPHEVHPWAPRARLLAFRRRWSTPDDAELLATVVEGWIRVARIVRVPVRAAMTLAVRAHDPLPVWYTRTGRVRALPCALYDWYDAQQRQHVDVLAGGPTTREDVCPPPPAKRSRAKEPA